MPQTMTFGSYRVVLELGAGSVSTVYRAEHERLGRIVAIKALKATIAPTSAFAASLEREARLLGELSHPNIVLLHDFVKTDTQMYLVLEHVDGFSLAAVLSGLSRKKALLAPEAVAHIGAEVARALSHAHERGIIHRDVKPANVLLSKAGDVKIVDFGIAQRDRLATADEPLHEERERKLTPAAAPSEAFGTPAYMSPEQILGEFVDARSDVFSLGVVLYELLCGSRPFEKDDKTTEAAQRIRRDPPTPLRVRAPDVPRSLERIVMRSLAKLPGDRFTSASAVADALDDFVRA
ncbi:MAG: serine/threonine-protein kinase, partial [Polyangiaceae bacterium]